MLWDDGSGCWVVIGGCHHSLSGPTSGGKQIPLKATCANMYGEGQRWLALWAFPSQDHRLSSAAPDQEEPNGIDPRRVRGGDVPRGRLSHGYQRRESAASRLCGR